MTPRSDHDKYKNTYFESATGYGGLVVGPDGFGRPLPEPEALEHAIPLWVDIPEHLTDAVSIYIDSLSRREPEIRLAAVTAIGEVVRRYRRLPHRAGAQQAVSIALKDPVAEVSRAAVRTITEIETTLGRFDDESSDTR